MTQTKSLQIILLQQFLENSYVTITYLQEQINVLNGTIAALEERIAALEPEPEPEEPENGDVTEPTDPETPTE